MPKTPFFTWLFNGDSAQFQLCSTNNHQNESGVAQRVSITRHKEQDPINRGKRYRLVYHSVAQESEIIDTLLALGQTELSLAKIEREQVANCIELRVVTELEPSQQQRLFEIGGVETFCLPYQTPSLNIPGLLVMDMDSTAIDIECIDELAVLAGAGESVANITKLAMLGELDFKQSLRQRVAQLDGMELHIIDNLCQTLPLMPGLEAMVRELKSYRWRVVLASGGFTPFANYLKELLNFDAVFANELQCCNGKLTGALVGEIVDAQFKAKVVLDCAKKWQIASGQSVAIGDGANDIAMIKAADMGIGYHGKEKLKQAADINIDQGDLASLPFLLVKS